MCVKTKTEWSCGCYRKALSPCSNAPDSRTPCSEVDKYRYLDDGDCKECRAGGADVTRGQDGFGRHAREIAAREKQSKRHSTRAILGEINGNSSRAGSARNDKSAAPIVTPDPWMKASRREKEWESPHRRNADQEWEREHASRKEDIESLWESHSSSPQPKSYLRRAATAPAEYNQLSEDEESLHLHHQRRNSGSLQIKIKETSNSVARSNRPRQSRTSSFESIESVPSRGRSRATPFQYGYATQQGYTVENRVPRDSYAGAYGPAPVTYRRR